MNTKELSNIIYDTLMGNTQFEQFNADKVELCEIDNEKAQINFSYEGIVYKLKIELI